MDKKQEDSRDLLRDVISLLENNKLLNSKRVTRRISYYGYF